MVCECRTSIVPHGTLQQQQSYGEYVVRIYRDEGTDEGYFEILKAGSRVYARNGCHFYIGSIYEDEKTNSLIKIGIDITGDGQPNLVVSEWTGGAHCCYLFHIFQIGNKFRHIQTIDARNSDGADFEKLDKDPGLEFNMDDWTFAYWNTSFAQSPAPTVILKYQGQSYKMACNLMRKPGLKLNDLKKLAHEINISWSVTEGEKDYPPVRLWAEMLDLIYTGNMTQAWTLANLAWPKEFHGKDQFVRVFKAQLKKSPFWKDVQKMNNGT